MQSRLRLRWCLTAALLLLAAPPAAFSDPPAVLPPAAEKTVDFRHDVYPLLKAHCFRCHQGRDAKSGYRLDLRGEILGETTGEPLAVPQRSEQSVLIQLVARLDPDGAMPPAGEGRPLTTAEVALLRAWVDQGLPWDDRLLPPAGAPERHWAFQPIRRPPLPPVAAQSWLRTPVDAFVAAQHEARGLVPAPQAARPALIRRLYLDLVGFPPSPEEVERFVADGSPQAWERLVDRLLASPHYGERWGRHWLDVARWAESEGYESNHTRPYAWRYRDWVVDAVNADMPYDRFLREQIAGDQLEPYADEHLVATGFLAAARLSSNEEDKLLQRNDVQVDIVNATASAVLGLTLRCAQCHDHKFDPLTQRDYYAMTGFFVQGQPNNLLLRDEQMWEEFHAAAPPGYEAAVRLRDAIFAGAKGRAFEEVRKQLTPEMRRARSTPWDDRTPEQRELARQADLKFQFTPAGFERRIPEEDRKLYDELKKKIERMEEKLATDKPQTWGFFAADSPHEVGILPMKAFYPLEYDPAQLMQARSHLLIRGDVHRPGDALAPSWPAIFGGGERADTGERPRLALVDWLVDRRNPLTARVWANRVWHYHFGRGIVATPDDFGLRGERPTHPKLLDWLASEFIDSGWSTKHLHRLILLSATYRQASRPTDENRRIDPENTFLSSWRPRRLEAEALRDSLLAASGELDLAVGGKSTEDEDSPRRAIYLLQKRDRFPVMQRLFDGPSANESCARRLVSTVAMQPLFLLNSQYMTARADALAERVRRETHNPGGPGERLEAEIDRAFRIALGRGPDDDERRLAGEFFASPEVSGDRLAQFCLALFSLNEFAYID